MWDRLLDALGWMLAAFYSVIPNYGIAIILLTITIRLVLYPLTAKQARSMAAMQRLQPEIKKIQQKYKNDRQKLNEELMGFYKEHQINPLSGCLPLVAQIPVFIALFQVLRDPSDGALSHIPGATKLFDAFCPGVGTIEACNSTEGLPRGLEFLSMDLSRGATADHGTFAAAIPFWILVGLVVVSGFLQSRQMAKLQKGRATPQSQIMTKVFPVVFGFISINLPAGVVLYFLVSNLWQIGQQAVVFGSGGPGERSDGAKKAKAPRESSGSSRAAIPAASKTVAVEDADDADADDGAEAVSDANRPNRSKSRKKKKRKRRR